LKNDILVIYYNELYGIQSKIFTLVVKQEIKILVKTKQAGNSPQIFPKLKTFAE
jgi:hypothetical protein